MDYRTLLIFIFVFSSVACENANESNNGTETSSAVTTNNAKPSTTSKEETEKQSIKLPDPKLPSLCSVCNCTDAIINCDKRNLTTHFEDSQWPNKSMTIVSFKENSLIHLKPFPKAVINKLILQKNKITKIDNCAFKQLTNLTELDLSYNELISENLVPYTFEGRFSTVAYEPLLELTVLNLAHNLLHSLHQDIFEHMPNLKVLNLSGNLFTKIDVRTSTAISSLVYLEDLDLSYCGLTSLPDTQFYSLRHLKKLDLSDNKFMVPPIALEEAKALESLYLDENPIQIINEQQGFPPMPNLTELSLCCMPHLTVIGAYAFSNLSSLENLRLQNCPSLTQIDEAAFLTQTKEAQLLPLKKLDLSDNSMRYLPSELVGWDSLEELHLVNNKWSCDCNNQFLIGTLLPKYGEKLMGDDLTTLTCIAPPEHAGKDLISLSHRTLRCLDFYSARPENDAMILISILVGVLLAIPVCLVIIILWRRGFLFCGTQGPASFSRAFYKRASNDEF